jgi:hypothetical protein
MALWTEVIETDEIGGSFTESEVVDLGGSFNVYASCALSKFNVTGNSPQAEIFISGYVQNGNPISGSWTELNANGVSSITVSLAATNVRARGVMTVTTDR